MIHIKTQATIFHNLNSFSLKTMYNVALAEYLTVSVVTLLLQLPKCGLLLYIRDSRLKTSSAAAAAAYSF